MNVHFCLFGQVHVVLIIIIIIIILVFSNINDARDWSVSQLVGWPITLARTEISHQLLYCIVRKFGTDIHGVQRMNLKDFDDP